MGLAATPHLLSPRPLPPAPQQACCIEDWLPSIYKLTSPKRQCRRALSESQVPVPQLAAVLSASPVSHEPVSPPSAFDDIVCPECTRGDEPEGNAILLCDGLLPTGDCDFACHQLCLPSPLSRHSTVSRRASGSARPARLPSRPDAGVASRACALAHASKQACPTACCRR